MFELFVQGSRSTSPGSRPRLVKRRGRASTPTIGSFFLFFSFLFSFMQAYHSVVVPVGDTSTIARDSSLTVWYNHLKGFLCSAPDVVAADNKDQLAMSAEQISGLWGCHSTYDRTITIPVRH
ncbi:hypothetical protein BDW71DRAFT_66035 [Aspergillus fruticulosus]